MATEATKITYVEGSAPSTPSSTRVVIYAKSDGLMYSKDDAGTETLMSGGSSGSVATDTIWDAAGDLAVGSGANTAAKLTIGAAGGAVSRVNGAVAWNSGTSFPTAATGDRYWRTDLRLEGFYDGTRWLSTTLYRVNFGATEVLIPKTDTNALVTMQRDLVLDEFGVRLEDFIATTFVATTNNGTHFWTVDFDWETAGASSTTLATFDTASDTAGNFTRHRVAIDAVLDSTAREFRMTVEDTGSPGTIRVMGGYTYRLILT
jgi:hypothetical protein